MVLLYLASAGPVAGLYAHKHISGRTYGLLCDTVYFPLAWLEFHSDVYEHPVGEAYVRYLQWFEK
jgi:hypothetical protein